MSRSWVTFALCILEVFFCVSCTRSDTKPSQSSSSLIRHPTPMDPSTLDPRMARNLPTIDIVRLLFSGLTRLSSDGAVVPELAQSIQASPDGICYRVVLKKAYWSDGLPITAHDFVYSWKSMLDAKRAAPNASQLFWINNAKAAFDGKMPADAIGLRALSDSEMEIELGSPCPFFDKVLATPAFLAVQMQYDQAGGAYGKNGPFPTSGPYCLQKWVPQTSLALIKNQNYVFSNRVSSETLNFTVVEDTTALTMFEARELDWAGSPIGTIPIDVVSVLKRQGVLHMLPAAGTAFLRVNTTKSPLSDPRVRKACSLVIDRQAIVDHILQGGQLPATSLVPPCMFQWKNGGLPDNRLGMAREALLSYCNDHRCEPKDISFSILFGSDPRSLKVATAVQQDISTHLHLNVSLQPCDPQYFYARISKLEYDLALGSWYADYFDPYSFYGVFERVSNGTNNTGWESSEYQRLLAQSFMTKENREGYFDKIEQVLAEELPIIPLYHGCFNYVKSSLASTMSISPLGHLEVVEQS